MQQNHKISNYLSNSERNLSKTEAKAFVQYMENPENKKRINEQLNKAQSNIDKDKQYRVDLGTITDAKDRTIIDIKKDGKKFFLIDKLAFTPHFNKVYVTENDNTGVYNYKLDGKRHTSSGSVAKLKLYAHLYKTIKANIVLTAKSFVSINYFSFFSINIT